ncbi:amidohydrolase [Dongshaea marina]|uniref:amidohydrolase n=1 Tax=Dongshaea marina TaxID=2047966 RepID=UPI000D3E7354|nr:amidohydrolase [Dongshaea marina]
MTIDTSRLKAIAAELTLTRHQLHQHPEISFALHKTSARVSQFLQELGLEVHQGLAQTGLVAILKGSRGEGPNIALRADMDALNIEESAEHSVRSQIPGASHACGHDGHTAILLATARYLSEHNDFAGTVYFLFQPAEEGEAGARVMIEEGLFERFPIQAIYGLHNLPGMVVGKIATRSGAVTAAGDTWQVEFLGSGGHGAMPHKVTDPSLATAHFITMLHTITSRNVPASEAAVVSVGHIHGGDMNAPNVIPSQVSLCGTARSFTPKTRDILEQRIIELANTSAQAFHCKAQASYTRRYPPTVNHRQNAQTALAAARRAVGEDKVIELSEPFNFSEDFSFYLEKIPGCFAFIGNGENCAGLHTPDYQFDDSAIETGMRFFIELIHGECQ